jgi:tRNA(Ile)-lysidine synthase
MQPNELRKLATLLGPGERIVVGVSGGIDSMVLVDILHRNRSFLRKDFKVLHVDHHISAESAMWAQFVQDWCDVRGIPCEVVDVDITQHGNNLEHAARQARYGAFAGQQADMIVLAHHANDQCETFFLKLFRGSGLKGLRCMSKSAPSWIDPNVLLVRPLLDWTKDRIKDYAETHGVDNIEDHSNSDTKFDRNWIRHDLWPLISERNEIADINVQRTIGLLNESWELTQDLARMDLARCRNPDNTLNWFTLSELSLPRLKNLILHILDQNSITGFSTHHVEDFARSLPAGDLDSRNELRVKSFVMRKIGKKVVYGSEI